MQFEEFTPVLESWKAREESPQAWKVKAAAIAANGYNLDLKNPNARVGLEHANPKDLVASMRSHESDVMRLLEEIEKLVGEVER